MVHFADDIGPVRAANAGARDDNDGETVQRRCTNDPLAV
jgi:hypothetical protein